MNKMVET